VRSVEVEDGVRVSPVVGEGSLVGKRLPDLWRRRGVCRRRRGRLDSEADGWRFRGGWKWGNRGVGDCWGGVCEPGRGTRERERGARPRRWCGLWAWSRARAADPVLFATWAFTASYIFYMFILRFCKKIYNLLKVLQN
jgi:hypothetical protein